MKTKDKLLAAGIEPGDADLSDIWAITYGKDDGFEFKKLEIGSELCGLVGFATKNQAALAAALGWSESRVSKVLSGSENLTLKTINDICSAVGYTFHVTFSTLADKRRPLQPWDHFECISDITHFRLKLQETVQEAGALLESARAVNKAAFRRDFTSFSHAVRLVKSSRAANEVRNGSIAATA